MRSSLVGSAVVSVICVALAGLGLAAEPNGVGLTVPGSRDGVLDASSKGTSFDPSDHAEIE
jgi:hypothetical protein